MINILKGKMDGGKFVSDSGVITVNPSDHDKAALKDYEGKAVYLGTRSERLIAGIGEENTFQATIEVIEMLGKEKLLYTKLKDGQDFIMSQPGHYEYAVDEVHNFHFDTEALHFFDGESTRRIN